MAREKRWRKMNRKYRKHDAKIWQKEQWARLRKFRQGTKPTAATSCPGVTA
jgi:hypothetical protein